jgi:hypothetical protein
LFKLALRDVICLVAVKNEVFQIVLKDAGLEDFSGMGNEVLSDTDLVWIHFDD